MSRRRSRRRSKKRSVRSRRKSRRSRRRSKKRSVRKSRRSSGENWIVYTLDGCPYCQKVIELLKSKGISPRVQRGEDSSDEIKVKLDLNGRGDYKTWPKVFKGSSFVGGYKDVTDYFRRKENMI